MVNAGGGCGASARTSGGIWPYHAPAGLKDEIKNLIRDVKAGDLDRNDAAVMIQGYRALKDFIALERQVKETDELAAEIEELKREYGVAG
ncbi:MAG: hypothetical protein M3N09_04680 [Actinomycetota bacterium]|nr:hypothetical protein [Actinomycetota bacterium]